MIIDSLKARLAGERPEPIVLPDVEAPPLHDLVVVVPPLPPEREIDGERLMELYRDKLLAVAPRRRKETGEFAEPGDEVTLTAAFFHEGKGLAFTAIDRETYVAGEPCEAVGLGEGLVGCTYDEMASIRATFPEDHEAPWLRGVSGSWRVHVRAIDAVSQPDWNDPDLDVDALMAALHEEEVAAMALELRNEAVQATLDLLRRRSPMDIPRKAVEAEIFDRWAHHEGRILLELDAGESDLNLSLAAWLRDAKTYADVERRIHVSALLSAIAQRDGIQLTHEALHDAVDLAATQIGVPYEEAKAAVGADPEQRAVLEQSAFHLQLVDHVMEHARIRYLEP